MTWFKPPPKVKVEFGKDPHCALKTTVRLAPLGAETSAENGVEPGMIVPLMLTSWGCVRIVTVGG